MMQPLRLLHFIAVLLSFTTATLAQTDPADVSSRQVTFNKTFSVTNTAQLDVNLSTQATLTLAGWDRNEVSVLVNMTGPVLEVEARQETGNVLVLSRYETVTHPLPTRGTIQIQVPRHMHVKVQLTAGQVYLKGLGGETAVDIQQGNIIGDDLNGKAYLTTNNGFVKLTGGNMESQVTTRSGAVSFDNVRGKLGGTGPSGHFAVNSPNKPVDAQITPGLLALLVEEGDVEASTSGALLEVTWKGDKLTRQRTLSLFAHHGTLVLNLPEGLGLETLVEQVREEEPAGDPARKTKTRKKLESDFYLGDNLPAERAITHQGKKLHLTRVEKQVNGGGNRLEIRAVNADIQLKKIE